MYPVSAEFISAIPQGHKIETAVTFTPPGEEAATLKFKRGTVSVNSNSNIRRRAALTVFATSDEYRSLRTDGTLFQVEHGIRLSAGTFWVPMIAGELSSAARDYGAGGEIDLPLVDLGVWIARCDFITPWVVAAGTTRQAAIAAIIADARPGTLVATTASSASTLSVAQTFTGSRWAAINTLAVDGGMEAFFGPDGVFIIRDQPTTLTSSVWTARGVVKQAALARPLDRLYNTVVVRPSGTDGSQTWVQQTAQISDTTHPRHPSKIGVVPYFYASPTIATAAEAAVVAALRLDKVQGTTESLSLGMVSNPALEGGDVIRVSLPVAYQEPADIFQHFIDTLTVDLFTGGMTLTTQQQLEQGD